MVEIVNFNPDEHLPGWEKFILSSYPNPNHVLLSPTFLRWQFFENPANDTGAYTLWLVVHNDDVVAQLGVVPFVGVSHDGSRFSGAYPINLMALPEYRSVGLGAILLNRLLKHTPCVLNPGVNEAGSTLGIGLGMHDLGLLRRYIAIVDYDRARSLAAGGRLPSGTGEAPASVVLTADSPTSRLPDHLENFSFPVPVYGAERSPEFLRWRYEKHPGFRYEFLFSPDLKSVLVFHEERESGTGTLVIRVVDFLARSVDQGELLASLVYTARARNAAIIDFFCSLDCYDEALKMSGFFNEADHGDSQVAALFQPLDFRKAGIRVIVSGPAGHTSLHDWYITKADSDQDRPNDKRLITRAVSFYSGS